MVWEGVGDIKLSPAGGGSAACRSIIRSDWRFAKKYPESQYLNVKPYGYTYREFETVDILLGFCLACSDIRGKSDVFAVKIFM